MKLSDKATLANLLLFDAEFWVDEAIITFGDDELETINALYEDWGIAWGGEWEIKCWFALLVREAIEGEDDVVV